MGKWLNAGVMEEGEVAYQERGTPQGGVISPLLSNIYLHEVLDRWFKETVQPGMKGKAFMVRYADDAVIGCELAEDAERIMKVLALRFAKYGLIWDVSPLHPEKTRLIAFTEPGDGTGKGKFYLSGVYPLLDKVEEGKVDSGAEDRQEAVELVNQRDNPMVSQEPAQAGEGAAPGIDGKAAGALRILRLPYNFKSLERFFLRIRKLWYKWLNRRSDKRSLYWWQYLMYLKAHPLPYPKIVHSYV